MSTLNRKRHGQRGYVLLTLLLFTALLTIAAAAAAPRIAFEIKRDREEELVHRGVQYSRGIQRFAKVTGRYPVRLEELQSTNNMKFIRRLYKDPVTGRDFRVLHMSDIHPDVGQPTTNRSVPQPPASASAVSNPDAPDSPDTAASGTVGTPPLANPFAASASAARNDSGVPSGQIIFGVASTSKAKSIRIFDKKDRYDRWLFFYDPAFDQGREIKGPTSLTPVAPVQLGGSVTGSAQNSGNQPQGQTPSQQP